MVKYCSKDLFHHSGRSRDHKDDADLDEGFRDGSCGRVVAGSQRSGLLGLWNPYRPLLSLCTRREAMAARWEMNQMSRQSIIMREELRYGL